MSLLEGAPSQGEVPSQGLDLTKCSGPAVTATLARPVSWAICSVALAPCLHPPPSGRLLGASATTRKEEDCCRRVCATHWEAAWWGQCHGEGDPRT